jgi:hypothetical protein
MMESTVIERRTRESEAEAPSKAPARLSSQSTAEVAECTCPEWCERDHDRD